VAEPENQKHEIQEQQHIDTPLPVSVATVSISEAEQGILTVISAFFGLVHKQYHDFEICVVSDLMLCC
jgi:hypothetical protein